MAVNPDGAPVFNAEAAAHRRWLITIVITILFGGFGAVMAYLSYANSSRPAAPSPGRSRSSGTAPRIAPAAPAPVVAPPAAQPSSTEGAKPDPKPDEGKPDKDK